MIHITDENINFETVIVLGNFDGIHVGHRKLISAAKKYAAEHGLALAAFSFNPHPVSVLGNPEFCTILTSDEKAFLMSEIGIDCLIEHKFDNAFASTLPRDFINDILAKKYKCRALFVGESYRFGKNHAGDGALLKELSKQAGIEAEIISEMYLGSEKVSSSRIRSLIVESEFARAEKLLGYPFFLMGDVVHGNKLGRTMGYPTANMLIPKGKLLPGNGVYLTRTRLDGKIYPGVTNIGTRPTVTDKPERVAETFLFNFDSNIYAKKICVEFLERIRDEKTFAGIDELKKQIAADGQTAKERFTLLHSTES